MPHQCIECDETYEDGTDDVLSGCSECGSTTFQFIPDGAVNDAGVQEPSTEDDNWMGGGVINSGESDSASDTDGCEDASQHAARTEVIDDLPVADAPEPDDDVHDDTGDTGVNIDALRQELNRQFEGIKILSPGQYEINLTRLFEREECIIALQKNGQYEINIPGRDGQRDISLDDR